MKKNAGTTLDAEPRTTMRLRGRSFVSTLLGSALMFLCCEPASAASIGLRSDFCPDSNRANCVIANYPGSSTMSDAELLSNSTGGVLDGSTSGTASFGTLGAFASATLSNYTQGTYQTTLGGSVLAAVNASASFIDDWTVFGGSVTDGFLNLTFNVTGTTSSSGSTGFVGGGLGVNTTRRTLRSGDFTDTYSLPVTIGSPQEVSVLLAVNIGAFDFLNPSVYDYSAVADFAQTAVLTDILITDILGNPIRGATLSAASGTLYPVSPLNDAVVPEPTTLLLLSLGLAGIGFTRRRNLSASRAP